MLSRPVAPTKAQEGLDALSSAISALDRWASEEYGPEVNARELALTAVEAESMGRMLGNLVDRLKNLAIAFGDEEISVYLQETVGKPRMAAAREWLRQQEVADVDTLDNGGIIQALNERYPERGKLHGYASFCMDYEGQAQGNS